MGYHTLIGDMGTSISGGQRQRILLARALYKRPRILFLDEATSALDVDREREVNQAIRQLDLTRIIVAHRPGDDRLGGPRDRPAATVGGRICAACQRAARGQPRHALRAAAPRRLHWGDERPGHRNLVRRDRHRARRGRRRDAAPARAGAAQPGRDAPRPTAASFPELASRDHIRRVLPLTREVLRAAGAELASIDVVAYTRGPGAGRRVAGRRRRGLLARRRAGQAGARRAPPRGPSAVALPVGRSAGVSVRRPAGLGRPHAADAKSPASASTPCSATRSTTPPARPSTSRPSCSASAIPAGRRWRGWPSSATRRRSPCRGRCCSAIRSTSPSPA